MAGFAIVAALSALRVALPGWVRPAAHIMCQGPHGRMHGALFAVGLVVLAHGLLRRRKVAYWVAMGLAGVGVLVAGRSVLALLLVACGVVMTVRRAEFPAVPRPSRIRTAAVSGLAVLGVGVLYDVVLQNHDELRVDMGSLMVLGVSVALVVLLAPAPAPPPADRLTRARVRDLVAEPSSDTLAPFVLRHDKAYAFSSTAARPWDTGCCWVSRLSAVTRWGRRTRTRTPWTRSWRCATARGGGSRCWGSVRTSSRCGGGTACGPSASATRCCYRSTGSRCRGGRCGTSGRR
ncbi:hypothetical protein GCM10029964_100880 [Kibdelosporangium lantanae]